MPTFSLTDFDPGHLGVMSIMLVLLVAAAIFVLFRSPMSLIANAASGLLLVFVLSFLGFWSIPLTLVELLIIALGGIPGTVLLWLLHALGLWA